ncbi:hypothetical protein ABZ128_34495 [Streptomyces sp. NPDC006326]|uniref:hypothetical protein n=1 Tax=Streptomyces sp. NPDC006326 TaxID=3156752 RepID=UPI0033A36FEF
MTSGDPDFDTAWRAAPEAVRRALGLPYEALAEGASPGSPHGPVGRGLLRSL